MTTSHSAAAITNGSPLPTTTLASIACITTTSTAATTTTTTTSTTTTTTTSTSTITTTADAFADHISESANDGNVLEADAVQQSLGREDEDQDGEKRNEVDRHSLESTQIAEEKSESPLPLTSQAGLTAIVVVASDTKQTTSITAKTEAANAPRASRSLSRSRIDTGSKSISFGLSFSPNPSPISPAPGDFPPAIRKTSPGLAARLKALGFGASKKTATATAPASETIGRLDEEQLRQLDEKHQAGSISAIISRRGRPWKGAGGRPSFRKSQGQTDLTIDSVALDASAPTPNPFLVPEIRAPPDPAMDTNKYRLPDHTNGNGTKATLETRREHLERNMEPLMSSLALSPSPLPSLPLLSSLPSPPLQAQAKTEAQQQPVNDGPLPPSPPLSAPPAAAASAESPTDLVPGINSYFPPGHDRPGSIYTLSRASFANQLAQLTSLQLPDAGSLSGKISAIPTAPMASKALVNAAEQIRSWISKAQEVISGLDSEDDVEWAAAGGREGLEEVENAITRFQGLIDAYVSSINELQRRGDVANVAVDDLRRAVSQMEAIVEEWARIRGTLQNVRVQVEIAMEWEELWNNVLGDIQGEMDELSRLVFEMEERRHRSLAVVVSGDGLDFDDLETIVEDSPRSGPRLQATGRFGSSGGGGIPAMPLAPSSPGASTLSQDDSNLLALFARMQPLRASLDFLPMRLSVFETRASQAFPTACEELEMRREGLDASYKKLERDAESLRKELGEDRWVIVFRGAGRQAQKMHESVERSLQKLKDGVEAGLHLTNQPSMTKKMESYEAKKTHYGPAIERVLAIIDRGVQDRLTVNGEILRLHIELESRWDALKRQMQEMDGMLEDMYADSRKGQQLRDSVSSMLSMDHSHLDSPRETPGSSPPSSVIMCGLGLEPPHTPAKAGIASPPEAPPSTASRTLRRRQSSLPAPVAKLRNPASRLSTMGSPGGVAAVSVESAIPRPGSSMGYRPRWNTSTNLGDLDREPQDPSKPCTPRPSSRMLPRSSSSMAPPPSSTGKSRLPTLRQSMGRASESPRTSERSPRGSSRLSFRERLASPGPQPLHRQMSSLSIFRSQPSSSATPSTIDESPSSRPSSSLAASRRASVMPQTPRRGGGRGSPPPRVASRFSTRKNSIGQTDARDPREPKPRWRF